MPSCSFMCSLFLFLIPWLQCCCTVGCCSRCSNVLLSVVLLFALFSTSCSVGSKFLSCMMSLVCHSLYLRTHQNFYSHAQQGKCKAARQGQWKTTTNSKGASLTIMTHYSGRNCLNLMPRICSRICLTLLEYHPY